MNEEQQKSCPCQSVLKLQEQLERAKTDIGKLYTTSGRLEERLDGIIGKMSAIETKVDMILQKPQNRWETVITCLISAAIAGIIASFIRQ